MSIEDEDYCRLCAEPTLKSSLISPDEDVAETSMIVSKMQWINVDICSSSSLPKAICYSCFDQLERTYRFLNTVRTAQAKLREIFIKTDGDDIKINLSKEVGKPVDEEWEEFHESKPNIKDEDEDNECQVITVDTKTLMKIGIEPDIKSERNSYDMVLDTDGFGTSDDEDQPLLSVAKKKKSKNKVVYKENVEDSNSAASFPTFTWDNYTWRCGNCDAVFQNAQSLRLHSLQIHAVCSVFKCNDCGKTKMNYGTFVKHVRYHQKMLRHCCEYCNKLFEHSSILKKHYASHKHELFYTCENCGSNFESPEELQDHIVIYTKSFKRKSIKDETYDLKCNICHKKFKTKSNLQQHKILHTERTRNFSCHVCGKMFFTKGTLGTHMMTHDDVKPYKCEYCSMSFRARGNLQSHVSLHSGAKPFVCEQCGKSFRVKRLLKSHYIVHTDLMPFICEYCNKTFRFKTRLNLHLRQHTGAKPYNCIYCQRDFTNGSNFKKHMKRRHNIDTSRKKFMNVVNHNNDDVIEQT